ncbi:MAG: hypothetical protein JNG88_17230 [Phycisphaerales bacterium]|nr:hypothetical protein [Phycisphaerales bacterium]
MSTNPHEPHGSSSEPDGASEQLPIPLRDWFAGMWVAGAAAHRDTPQITDLDKASRIAEQAYRVADAMLLCRSLHAED